MTNHLATSVEIRPEADVDHDAIRGVVASAFNPEVEVAGLVDALRVSPVFIPELSLVATVNRAVVGHVLLTAAELVDHAAKRRVLVLSPLSVLPEQQRQGIGGALVMEALARADAAGEEMVVLQGSPATTPASGSATAGRSMSRWTCRTGPRPRRVWPARCRP